MKDFFKGYVLLFSILMLFTKESKKEEMIGFIHGIVEQVREKSLLILTQSGVGYRVFPVGALLSEAKTGKELHCYIYTLVREQEISLYGFSTYEEQLLFEKVLGVSGVGPKLALSILSMPVHQFLSALETGDIAVLTKIPGLGKKTAQRLLLDLKGKLDISESTVQVSATLQEAIEALMYLGYEKEHIKKVLEKSDADNSEDLVKYYLTHMHEK